MKKLCLELQYSELEEPYIQTHAPAYYTLEWNSPAWKK